MLTFCAVTMAQPLVIAAQTPSQPSSRSAQLKASIARDEWARDTVNGLASTALASGDADVQRLAIRAIGRRQQPDLRAAVEPFLHVPNAALRIEAANALGQMGVDAGYAALVAAERDGNVRAVLFESAGRVRPAAPGTSTLLINGLTDSDKAARTGAARGLEAFVRLNARTARPGADVLDALHKALAANTDMVTREYLLLAMNSARDSSAAAYALALRDTSALVRRLAVIGAKQWVDDKSPLVRYEALKVAGTCERATVLTGDASEMVALAAIDMLGDKKCAAPSLEALAKGGKTWRIRAHALVAMAKTQPAAARSALPEFASSPLWHNRVYAATAAKVLHDSATLQALARDTQPNVAVEAMNTPTDAMYALSSGHAGLLLAAANKLKGTPELFALGPQIISAIEQPGMMARASSADARNALLDRLLEIYNAEMGALEKQYGARAADTSLSSTNTKNARALLEHWGKLATVNGETLAPPAMREPLASPAVIARQRGAAARITMRGLGVVTLDLLFDEAPNTVTTFATLAHKGAYNGLTLHRVVPNFVLQGGSPGADEYDGQTEGFMLDEVGRTSHARGTLGISTRGYDKGDGQIFVNLVDNFRLDYQYTVFARVTSGMDIVDRIQEGDVIESVKIIRKP